MVWIGLSIAAVVSISLVIAFYQVIRLRRKHPNPTFVPTRFLKSKWRAWEPVKRYHELDASTIYDPSNATVDLTTTSTSYAPSTQIPTSSAGNTEVDRRTSVRSIMTLPPYRYTPNHDEQLIAREGERAGVDTVIEYPESENEAEDRREVEMQALFEIRQARRREAEEREARKRARREAREQGDWARLEQLEQESRARARARSNASVLTAGSTAGSAGASRSDLQVGVQSDSAFLIAELASQREAGVTRPRVSSVSYADLGLARHDGSRIRADSTESDVRPLLDSAASMGGSRAASRQSSPGRWTPFRSPLGHGRQPSDASALSVMTADSDLGDGANTPRTTATRSGSDENGFSQLHLTPTSASEAPSMVPPRYEDEHASPTGEEAPPYESPVQARGRGEVFPTFRTVTVPQPSQLPSSPVRGGMPPSPTQIRRREVPQLQTSAAVRHPPAIEVSSATPVNSVPGTPVRSPSESRRSRG
ncbi:hypothetical protein MMC19_000850 [Ptychographa xylographoides]|nr:hypothetical protein [Ptychographa xylographoides]